MVARSPGPRQRDPFEALADPTRRGILELLRDNGVRTAGEIADAFPAISRPAVSRHLRVLRESGIVVAEQVGREWRYQIDGAMLARAYRDWFERFAPFWEQSLERLKRHVESDEGANDG
jgi:DNA-binding transcriptional ArsR family regulator